MYSSRFCAALLASDTVPISCMLTLKIVLLYWLQRNPIAAACKSHSKQLNIRSGQACQMIVQTVELKN